MAYCTYTNIRVMTNITTTDISNDDITSIITYIIPQLNKDIQVEVIRERIEYIDTTRENTIDGSNTKFYARAWKDFYFGDGDNDGDVDINDITVNQVDSSGTETTLTVSSIDADEMSFVLSAAPASTVSLYLTYHKSPFDMSTPDPLIKLAAIFLTTAYCYAKINLGKSPKFKMGNTVIERSMDDYIKYIGLYKEIIEQINCTMDNIIEAEHLI